MPVFNNVANLGLIIFLFLVALEVSLAAVESGFLSHVPPNTCPNT